MPIDKSRVPKGMFLTSDGGLATIALRVTSLGSISVSA
jgi:hypothetical protein